MNVCSLTAISAFQETGVLTLVSALVKERNGCDWMALNYMKQHGNMKQNVLHKGTFYEVRSLMLANVILHD